MKKQNVRTLSLLVGTFTYLLVGAAVFDALESETEKRRWEALEAIEKMVIKKFNITLEDFKVMETVVLKTEPHKAGQQWKFAGAFYYATTVLTTIGYGHSTPNTVGGKVFTMCYAMIGIPLGLVMFQSIGERLNKLSSVVIRNIKRMFGCQNVEASEINLICVVTTLSSMTIAGGAAAFSRYEGWTYFDSVYYCFITLTTIGFGDMVALQKDNSLDDKPEYVAFTLIFILLGLAIVAASLNLLVLRFVTMNTEDERRDEAEALQAAQGAVRLEGDVITSNGSIISGGDDAEAIVAAITGVLPGDELGAPTPGGGNLSGRRAIMRASSGSLAGRRLIPTTEREGSLIDSIDRTPSVCSCSCTCAPILSSARHRYTVRRSPGHISHLLPLQPLSLAIFTNEERMSSAGSTDFGCYERNSYGVGECGSMWPPRVFQRASI